MSSIKRNSGITPEMMIEARLKANLTQSQAAELIGKSLRTYKYYEAGSICPTKSDYAQLLRSK